MRSLNRLLRPRSVAVIGGGAWCANVLRECRRAGFDGALYAVHPTKTEVGGVATVASVANLPEAPDAVFIGVNRALTVETVAALSAMGAGGAICFASGFAEAVAELTDGGDMQAALLAAAGDMPILGPNCYGFINALDGVALWPDQHGLVPVERGVAIIGQSSNIALNLTMQTRGLPIAYLVTAGNQAQTGLSGIGEALLDDPRVSAIGLHIEGIDDLAAFQRFALKAQTQGVPVVALKVGRSDQARAATVSHTASIAGGMAGAEALFDRLGVARVQTLAGLLECLKLMHVTGPLPSGDIVSMSCSGGEASLIADLAHGRGAIRFASLSEPQRKGLRAALGPKVALANPLDYHTYIWGNLDATRATITALVDGPVSLGLIVLDLPRPDRCRADDWFTVIEAAKLARAETGKPLAILSSLPETMPEAVAQQLVADGLVPLCGMAEALEAIEAAARAYCPAPPVPVHVPGPVLDNRLLTEAEAKTALAEFGLPVPRGEVAADAESAIEVARRIGFPVVLKGLGLAHKSESGAVALNLRDAAALRQAAQGMPGAGFLVEAMVPAARAELLVGVLRDPAHGLVLTLAAGGVLTELMTDRVSLILPVTRSEVETALLSVNYGRVLTGYRGAAPCDMGAILDAVIAVQDFALSTPVLEVEINPLLCGADFAVAADALVQLGEADDR
ncbi:acetate--CoA ligase family protein [Thetidibacter halocola]|uniref:Acetate--CoA ligase family protein n=1 Tax=Thetidibacter halocola TaxID=2827239 RepID=A0A8J7WGG9_9RHOB|nr:acetate--CoA ligase family protein [Thetidibacter halocola]MBS0124886.1 acetate--CoA ligase family protein [Thetidibacter halocola]